MAPKKFTTSNYDLFSYGKIEVGVVRKEKNMPIVILDPEEGLKLYTSSGEISEGDGRFHLNPNGGIMTMRGKDATTGDFDRLTVKLSSGSGGEGGQLKLYDSKGKTTISLSSGDHEVNLYNSAGTSTVRLDGQAGTIFAANADLAENFACWQEHKEYEPGSEGWAEITDPIEAGDVLVISEDGKLVKCTKEYDRRVAGVVSGAKDYKPAIILDDVDMSGTEESYDGKGIFPIALAGKAYCKVTGEVTAGDLLVTSPRKGFAMRADPKAVDKMIGAILGKALVSKPATTYPTLIPILVMLG